MSIAALAIALLGFQVESRALLPYSPAVAQTSVRSTAGGAVTCSLSINGQRQPDVGCDIAAGAPDGLRRMQRDAELTMIFAILPEGPAARDSGGGFGELIVEGRARLSLAPDGRVTRCDVGVARVIRRVAGVQRPPAFCQLYPVGQRVFEAAEGAGPRMVELSVLVYLREGPPPR